MGSRRRHRFRGAVLSVAAAASVITPGTSGATDACPPPRCIDAAVPVPPGLRVPDNRVRVLLPTGYDADPCRRWPVLYLLHGVGDTWESWSNRSDVVDFTREVPVIVVMPDGGKSAEAGWYSDWADASRQWETFHIGVVVPWVDATFRTAGDGHRMIAGLSMGGFGAMSYAARHRGLFGVAASFSGYLDTRYVAPASGIGYGLANPYAGTPDERVWGDQVRDESTWREHNPADRAADLAGTTLLLYAGMGVPGGAAGDNSSKPANYGVEQFVFQTNLSFTRALDRAGVAYEADFHPGFHDWPYYQAGLHWALPKMMATPAGAGITACRAAPAAAPSTVTSGELPATGGPLVPVVPLVSIAVAAVLWHKVARGRPHP